MARLVDLSDSSILEIKVLDKTFKLRDLTKKEMESYDEAVKVDPFPAFDQLLTTMGMPKEVVEKLGQAAKTRIMEAIFEEMSVKKK